MNRFARLPMALFGFLFLTFFVLSLHTIVDLARITSDESAGESAQYHFALFLPEESYSFFHQVAQGARTAATEYNCALSFHPVGYGSPDLAMAHFSGIDGAVIYPSIEEQQVRTILEQLSANNISVVLVEHTISDDAPWPFVGTNNFDIGRKIGELIALQSSDPLQIAVVYSEKSPGIYAEKDLVGLGITSALGKRLESPPIAKMTNLNPLDAEALTYRMLRSEPGITTIVFTDARDTLAATQVLIDMNLVGTVQLIGFGAEETILDYVEKGILAGTVVTNPRSIGYHAIEVLFELKRNGHSAGYVDTGVTIVTQSEVSAFRKVEEGK
ncbi:sugar ABC transporter substrate-binding protein [Sediminispirochaeta bajacaliforniensis]|uniref:sugar ABC transporter substrate-binding protein n=1 Tax=Sediminispirochaeta bajacaliforniensis TaxID=148 RepID=UPI00035C92C2|nr:substrate-binding domain-containing protein [Sediminispirochaeta bajacaliforniensis]